MKRCRHLCFLVNAWLLLAGCRWRPIATHLQHDHSALTHCILGNVDNSTFCCRNTTRQFLHPQHRCKTLPSSCLNACLSARISKQASVAVRPATVANMLPGFAVKKFILIHTDQLLLLHYSYQLRKIQILQKYCKTFTLLGLLLSIFCWTCFQ